MDPTIEERALAMVQALLPYAKAGKVTADYREPRRRTIEAAERLLAEAEAADPLAEGMQEIDRIITEIQAEEQG